MIISNEIKAAYSIGMSQEKLEIEWLLNKIKKKKIKNIVEIGSKLGGTLYLWRKVATNKVISVDLKGGSYGGWILQNHPYLGDIYKKRNSFFKKLGVTMISGNSRDSNIIQLVKNNLEKEPIDLLFIDGDHTYEGSKADYENYSPLVRKGGLIVFHDICENAKHNDLNVGVGKLFNELKGKKDSFIQNKEYSYGIGIIEK